MLSRIKPLATILAEGADTGHGLRRSLGPWTLTAMGIAVPILRKRHPELTGKFTLPWGPYAIPIASAISALILIYFLKVGNPMLWGFFPLVWFAFLVWLIIGLIFYFSYGRNKSTVALQELERNLSP